MRTTIKSMWQSASVTRIAVMGIILMFVAFGLVCFLAGLGDSDLPPYDPPFPGERFGWGLVTVIAWPLVIAALVLGHDPSFILWFPLMLLGGVFWASLIETFIVFRYVRRA